MLAAKHKRQFAFGNKGILKGIVPCRQLVCQGNQEKDYRHRTHEAFARHAPQSKEQLQRRYSLACTLLPHGLASIIL